MSAYLWLKLVHLLGAAVLLGTGIGIAYFKWSTDRTGNVHTIRVVSERVVVADWLFTATAIVIQPVSGSAMVAVAGIPLNQDWIVWSIGLYLLAGACWLPVVWLQMRMRELARVADACAAELPLEYRRYSRVWFVMGIPAFASVIGVYWLMVFKP